MEIVALLFGDAQHLSGGQVSLGAGHEARAAAGPSVERMHGRRSRDCGEDSA